MEGIEDMTQQEISISREASRSSEAADNPCVLTLALRHHWKEPIVMLILSWCILNCSIRRELFTTIMKLLVQYKYQPDQAEDHSFINSSLHRSLHSLKLRIYLLILPSCNLLVFLPSIILAVDILPESLFQSLRRWHIER